MTSPQPPEYFVQGADQRSYPADAATLQEWIRRGTVRPDQMVFSTAEQRWVRASELLPSTPPPPRKPRNVKAVAIGCALIFLLFAGSFAVLAVVGKRMQDEEARDAAAKKEQEQEAQRKQAAGVATSLAQQLTEHDAALRERDSARADEAIRRSSVAIQPYLAMKPVPPEIATLLPRYEVAKQHADLRARLQKQYAELITTQEEATRLSTEDGRAVDAEKLLQTAQQTADRLRNEAGDADVIMPADFDPAARRREIDKALRVVSPKAERQRKNEREATALIAVCGEKPACSAWDDGCFDVESAVKRRAHDPSSIDVENCTDPVLHRDACWVTTCDVRGKNAFGARVLHRKRFAISKLGVEELSPE